MSTVGTKMTAIADEIRTLSGTTDPMGLDAMATNVSEANTEISDQADLIAQLASALEGKSVSGGSSVETCTIRLVCTTSSIYGYFYLAYQEGQFVPVYFAHGSSASAIDVTLPDVVCGGGIYIQTNTVASMIEFSVTGDATAETPASHMVNSGTATVLVYAPNIAGSESIVTIIDND